MSESKSSLGMLFSRRLFRALYQEIWLPFWKNERGMGNGVRSKDSR